MAGSMSSRKACSATRVPVSLLGKQWLVRDKNTSQQIPRGDGPKGSVQEGEVAQPFLQPRVLREELQNNPTLLAKYTSQPQPQGVGKAWRASL